MRIRTTVIALVLAIATIVSVHAEEKKAKAKAYPLKTCIVTDEALDGGHGEPYGFEHEGQEIKMCCKSCLKKFNKDKATYLKKLEKTEKKAK